MLVLKGEKRFVTGLAFSPDGTRLAAVGEYAVSELWDVAGGNVIGRGPRCYGGSRDNVRFDRTGNWLLVAPGSGGLAAIDVRDRVRIASRTGKFAAAALAVSPIGNRLLVKHTQLAAYELTPTKGVGKRLWAVQLSRSQWTDGLDFFPDGRRFASIEYVNSSPFGFGKSTTFLRVRSSADGRELSIAEVGTHRGGRVRVSPDGAWIAVQFGDHVLFHHTTDPKKTVALPKASKNLLTSIAFHPSGQFLAATSNDATVRLHDRDANWKVTRTFDWKIGRLRSIVFSADGSVAAAGGDKGRIVVWDVDL